MSAEKKLKIWAVVFLALAALGFFESTYLTVEHYRGEVPPCALVTGCETVLTSKYSAIAGIPVALFGAFYYLLLATLAVVYLDKRKAEILKLAARLTWLGLATSVILVGLQIFAIKATCLYCLASAAISTSLFIIGRCIIKIIRKSEQNEQPEKN